MESGIEINAEKTKYIFTYRKQNAGKNYCIKIDKYFANVVKPKY
jgi:3-dehydroquinate dehydratase